MNYKRAILVVLLIAAASCGTMEVLARVLLPRMSRLIGREIGERKAVLLPPHSPGHRLLVIGNSLLLEGVDFPALQTALAPDWTANRFAVDDTSCLDWYYGLRRLFREGARFDAVALMLTPQQLTTSRVRGSYSAWRLMSPGDIVSVSREADLSPTEGVNMFLSSVSEFYGMRTELRKVLLGHLIPNLPDLMTRFAIYPHWEPNPEEVFTVSQQRLARFRDLSRQNSTRFILIVPPISAERDGAGAVIRAGESVQVPVVAPIRSGTLPLSLYRDGFHLKDDGVRQFTTVLAESLKQTMGH